MARYCEYGGRQKYCGTEESRPTFFSACRQSSSADHCRRLLLKNLELLMAPAGERDMSNDRLGKHWSTDIPFLVLASQRLHWLHHPFWLAIRWYHDANTSKVQALICIQQRALCKLHPRDPKLPSFSPWFVQFWITENKPTALVVPWRALGQGQWLGQGWMWIRNSSQNGKLGKPSTKDHLIIKLLSWFGRPRNTASTKGTQSPGCNNVNILRPKLPKLPKLALLAVAMLAIQLRPLASTTLDSQEGWKRRNQRIVLNPWRVNEVTFCRYFFLICLIYLNMLINLSTRMNLTTGYTRHWERGLRLQERHG